MTARTAPAVTVVMPVHRVERFVASSVRSVLAQTCGDFELVVVDDGSDDGSMDEVRAAAGGDGRLRCIRQENRGLAGARNTGIAAGRGRYVALLDSDDMWTPDKLERHVAHLDQGSVDVSCCASVLIGEDGLPIGVRQDAWMRAATPEDVFCGRVVRNGSVPVIRRSTLEAARLPDLPGGGAQGQSPGQSPERAQYFDEGLRRSEDVECWTRLAVVTGARFGSLPDALTLYRINAGGLSADTMRQLRSWDDACARIAAYAPDFVARMRAPARARELRYLARRAFQQRDRGLALHLAAAALGQHPPLLWREPGKTGTTLAACLALRALPPRLFGALLNRAAPAFAGRAG